jgi:hypothetical protein
MNTSQTLELTLLALSFSGIAAIIILLLTAIKKLVVFRSQTWRIEELQDQVNSGYRLERTIKNFILENHAEEIKQSAFLQNSLGISILDIEEYMSENTTIKRTYNRRKK